MGSLRELGPEAAPPPTRLTGRPDRDGGASLVSGRRIAVRSGRPDDQERRRVRRPVAVRVPALGLRAAIVPVGVRGRDREMALPQRPGRVGWYRHGSSPGRRGVAVLAAHADWQGRPGPFLRVAELEPGDRVRVGFRRGPARGFRVIARRSYDKERLPRRLFARTGRPAIALVTCGGPYDRATRTYARNTVVWAVPISR